MRHFQKEDAFQKLNPKNEASKHNVKIQTLFNKLMEEYQTQYKSVIHPPLKVENQDEFKRLFILQNTLEKSL